jgi:hypothetical protein
VRPQVLASIALASVLVAGGALARTPARSCARVEAYLDCAKQRCAPAAAFAVRP